MLTNGNADAVLSLLRKEPMPMLVGSESKTIAPIITGMNNTSTLSALFANLGEDIVSDIEYDPEWFMEFVNEAPTEDDVLNDHDWQIAMRVEMQILNAFLRGAFIRPKCSTRRLEWLFAHAPQRKPRSASHQWSMHDVCDVLSLVDEFRPFFMQFASSTTESFSALPLYIDKSLLDVGPMNVQTALDGMFWREPMQVSENFDINAVPTLETLNKIFIVNCPLTVKPDAELWLDRYTQNYLPYIDTYWHKRHDLMKCAEQHQIMRTELLSHDGKSMIPEVEKSIGELKNRGLTDSAADLERCVVKLKEAADREGEEFERTKQEIRAHSVTAVVPINPMVMTPWIPRAILWLEEADGPIAAFARGDSSMWILTADRAKEQANWHDTINSVASEEGTTVIYERKASYLRAERSLYAGAGTKLAPSIFRFVKEDDAHLTPQQIIEADNAADEIRDARDGSWIAERRAERMRRNEELVEKAIRNSDAIEALCDEADRAIAAEAAEASADDIETTKL